MPTWMKMNLTNGFSPIMEQLIMFHDLTMMITSMILTMVMTMMWSTMKNKFSNRTILENQILETTWTVAPGIILIMIALPSLKILYLMEEIINPSITIKTIAHQWYWSYELSDKKKIEFESYMTNEKKNIRLMEVDNRVTLPFSTKTRMIITSSDVIHSWSMPSLGIKMDAVPGRLNQVSFTMNKPGIFVGQCSEICGTNHSFMPITLESISLKKFMEWINK
uniref:cytochrome c oxidase subunit II n=1 Tax=Pseudochoutagus curvativus TaxID=3081119 RepID=UPI002A7EFF3A|nr:cytochrome c oxidase subunit II [Pseudochoutagus curvativus]WOW98894.1 cytochrome c oxidase subunit II [Pseudochoutagus curvativus]